MSNQTPTQAALTLLLTGVRDTLRALLAQRADGAALAGRLDAEQRLRVIVDEAEALVVFTWQRPDGRAEWIDSVKFDPDDPATFGRSAAALLTPPDGPTH